jgi:hypothetical protein
VANAYLAGIFSTMVTDSPANDFQLFNCPLLLGGHETNQVSVSIANPTGNDLAYTITIAADGLVVGSPACEQTASIPSHQTTTLVWPVTAVAAGNQAIVVQAVSANDAARPGPFHSWPTSFRQGCGVLVLNTPLSGSQVMGLIRNWRSGRNSAEYSLARAKTAQKQNQGKGMMRRVPRHRKVQQRQGPGMFHSIR